MPYVMPWHLDALTVDAQRQDVTRALRTLFTAYQLGTISLLGHPTTSNPERAMMEAKDLFLESFPSEKDSHYNWTIKRADHERPTPLIVMSSKLFGVRTHFWYGRSAPCLRADCPACAAGRLSRWTGYVCCIEPSAWVQVLFEFTPPAAEQLQAIIALQGCLRGSKIIAARAKKNKHARVTVTARGLYEHMDRVPKEPEILPILFHIWGMKPQEPMMAEPYDVDALPESEKPKRGKKAKLDPSAEAIAQRLLDDLPGQARLFPASSNGRAKT